MSLLTIVVNVPDNAQTVAGNIRVIAGGAAESIERLGGYIQSLPIKGANVTVNTGGVQALGTITLASFVQNDTVTINGVTLTGKNSPSGASEFAVDADDVVTAANLAAKINASALAKIAGNVSATSALKVVTVSAIKPGYSGNLFSIAISAHGTVSGALLTGGAEDATVTLADGY